ncbi:PilN domain-containing protein [Biformimicrobium ophioploci]|uniref:Type 4a pilus biogenesis protein PilN n=1 Tax=Biformimicrobium ophioploci TaxID=3036711 RepID=A0ABQ6LV44_9GAMM|nr:PilN domain-containing protein [Microbulbifer sp. NKW57]GMG85902.1 type 4a pilus biogenesis protein PilN [Microbulbifer sp. NKW57]
MAKINLLPWRQEYREQKQKEFTNLAVVVVLAAAGATFGWMKTVDGQIDNQNARNARLQNEIRVLDKQVAEIKDLKKRKQELLDRMRVIQELQGNRPLAVRYFDELVRAAPEGLWLTNVKRVRNKLEIEGIAESNPRISSLMRNLDQSEWYTNSDLDEITANPEFGEQAMKFKLNTSLVGRKIEEDAQKKGAGKAKGAK